MKMNNKEKGSALVIVLGMLAVLMLMAVAFSIIMRTERAGTTNLRHSLTAQNGIQSAIAHAISDIDKKLGDSIVSDDWKYGLMASFGDDVSYDVLQSGDSYTDVRVTLLNERAQRHLNPTTRALVKNAKIDWRLLYAGVPLSNYASDGIRLEEDSIVGRIAYVAVNTTGYLDPNIVTLDGVMAYPEATPQLNNNSFAAIGKKNVTFSSKDLLAERDKESKYGFTSFADLVAMNEKEMYDSNGRVKGAPKMMINLFAPNKASCLFLPDVFGPAAAFGLSPYPPKVEIEDYEPLSSAIELKKVKELDLDKTLLAFKSVFARTKWIEKGEYGESAGKKYEKDLNANEDGEISWKFAQLTRGDGFNRSDLALLSLAGRYYDDKSFQSKVISAINEETQKIVGKNILNAPCFKPIPLFSSIIGWTDKPKFAGIYSTNESGNFPELPKSEEGPEEVTITADTGKTPRDYYARFLLPVHFSCSAVSLYKDTKPGNIELSLTFGPNADGSEIFDHITDNSKNSDLVIDPHGKFADFVDSKAEIDSSIRSQGQKFDLDFEIDDNKTSDGVIEVFVRYKGDKPAPTEDAPVTLNRDDFQWRKASFDTSSLSKYSIDVFAKVEITSTAGEQTIPAPGYRKKTSGIFFKLPLFGNQNENSKDFHRIGYAMAIDPRFAFSSHCLHEYEEETAIDEDMFPYWVNNVMAENISAFSELKNLENEVEEPADLNVGGRNPDAANPYARLAMGFPANEDEEGCGNDTLWKAIRVDEGGARPFPDTLHKVPGTSTYLANTVGYDNKDFVIKNDTNNKEFENLGDLGSLCIGPWETISLYSTETPDGKLDFHTVFDFFTLEKATKLTPNKLNLNAPPLLMTQEGSSGRVKLAKNHNGSYLNPKPFDIDGNVKIADYVDASNGMNPEPLTAILYGLEFDYRTSWEIASRIIYQNMDLGSSDGVTYFKDISQIGYGIGDESLLNFMLSEENSEVFVNLNYDVTSDSSREKLLGLISNNVTTRGQTFTIVIRSDAFAPKFGSNVDGTTLASKVAVVEAWRDTEPARDEKGESLGYHNWHIRSVRIVD